MTTRQCTATGPGGYRECPCRDCDNHAHNLAWKKGCVLCGSDLGREIMTWSDFGDGLAHADCEEQAEANAEHEASMDVM